MKNRKPTPWLGQTVLTLLFCLAGALVGCRDLAATPTPVVDLTPTLEPAAPSPTSQPTQTRDIATPAPTLTPATGPAVCPEGLSLAACNTLQSLRKVDDYPLYTMFYDGYYWPANEVESTVGRSTEIALNRSDLAWGCSLFAAFADGENGLFGRNFDWRFSPAMLLFTDPPDGYAAVTMVDIDYLITGSDVNDLENRPIADRLRLLDAPFWPFDGMNEHGLVVGMAAVPSGRDTPDPGKEQIGSLMVMRAMLDGARDVEEALQIFTSYNIMGGGPPIHYLIADASGRSLLLEFHEGELLTLSNETNWQLATNFLQALPGESATGQCWRYDQMDQEISEAKGHLSVQEAIALLAGVAQDSTQWSIVYGINSGEINVTMGQQFDTIHSFQLGDSSTPAP